MSIVCYTGKMGHGKTYTAVSNVLMPALMQGRYVITNIPVETEILFEKYPEYRDRLEIVDSESFNEDCFRISTMRKGAYYIYDEVGPIFPSGIKQHRVDQDIQEFFTKHRHMVNEDGYSCEIALIVQDFSMLAMFLRVITDQVYVTVKRTGAGKLLEKKYDVYVYAPTGGKYSKRNLQVELTGKYKEEHWKYYRSHTLSDSNKNGGLEVKADDRGNFFKSWKFRSLIIMFIISLMIMLYGVSQFSLFGSDNTQIEELSPPSKPSEIKIESIPSEYSSMSFNSSGRSRSSFTEGLGFIDINQDPHMNLPLSGDWKIVGEISSDYTSQVLIQSDKGNRFINKDYCRYFGGTNDLYCILRGEVVSYLSGPDYDDKDDSIISLSN